MPPDKNADKSEKVSYSILEDTGTEAYPHAGSRRVHQTRHRRDHIGYPEIRNRDRGLSRTLGKNKALYTKIVIREALEKIAITRKPALGANILERKAILSPETSPQDVDQHRLDGDRPVIALVTRADVYRFHR